MPSLAIIVRILLAVFAIPSVLAAPYPQPSNRVALHSLPDCTSAHNVHYEMCHTSTPRSVPSQRMPSNLSNGERLARGLPLKPPTRRSSSPRAVASPTPNGNRGYIQVVAVDRDGHSHGVLGYIAKNMFNNAQYLIQPTLDGALVVSPDGKGNLITEGASHRMLGLVRGRESTSSSLGQGSGNYVYLASVDETAPNATPQTVGSSTKDVFGGSPTAESAVWTLDPNTHRFRATWVNEDASRALTIPISQGSAIYFTDDVSAFQRQHSAPVQLIEFVHVAV